MTSTCDVSWDNFGDKREMFTADVGNTGSQRQYHVDMVTQ